MVLVIGIVLVVGAAVLPWATTEGAGGSDSVSGFGHGGEIAVVPGIVALGLAIVRLRALASAGAVAMLVWTGLVLYTLPGDLTDDRGVTQADLSWGAYAALLASLVLLAAALRRAPRNPPG